MQDYNKTNMRLIQEKKNISYEIKYINKITKKLKQQN